LNDALTSVYARSADWIHQYDWAFEELGGALLELQDWYDIAHDANGNATICHRATSEILMFAPAHCFDHITPLEGYPDYTLYRIKLGSDFRLWVECVARQWLAHMRH
jgi:hypothetical protein